MVIERLTCMLPVCDFQSGLEGSVTVTYIHWVILECIMFSVMVASYERDESSFEAVHELVVSKWHKIFLFFSYKV